jgi:hypothetical protein
MAVKISVDHMVSVLYPRTESFTLGEIHDIVGSSIDPLCFDHFWLIYDETGMARKKPLNQIASLVFGVPLYGDVVTVPVLQMPDELELFDENVRTDYQTEAVDNGVLLTIQKALDYQRQVNEGIEPTEPVEEWIFNPEDELQTKGDIGLFYSNVYNFIIKNPDKFKQKNIIFSDMFLQIKLATSKERIDIISKMIKHFEILEEYEKCSVLKKDFIDTTY